MSELADRRQETSERIDRLKERLADAAQLVSGSACVYATGSFGRREAGKDSDLDLFIVSKTKKTSADDKESQLRRLDEICVKADLIKATKDLGIKEFDGDGRYLVHYTIDDIVSNLGKPEDDSTNTFTARLLLLLESTPLLEGAVYKEIVDDVIAAYWKDFEDHKGNFVPAFLTNDIQRLWRTFCVNYEARTEREPEEKNIKRRKKNYTLKHSRLLTCYSGLLYLLAMYGLNNTVIPDDIREMVRLSPTERLQWILGETNYSDSTEEINGILTKYEEFLSIKANEDEFHGMFINSETTRASMEKARGFSETFFNAINKIGRNNKLHKAILV